MAQTVEPKDPGDVLSYRWDFAPETNESDTSIGNWLTDAETIVSHTITMPSGLTLDSSSITDAAKSVTAWFSGGTADTVYRPVCHITTSTGAQVERTMTIRVRDR